MEQRIRTYNKVASMLIFVGLPILLVVMGESQDRSLLKEAISYLTILSFCMLIAQFFLARSNKNILSSHKMGQVIKVHKFLGYVFVSILIIHPFLIVLPRYFEAGIEPLDAFTTIITSFNSQGIVLGLIAWSLMFIIGITSAFRNHLRLKYKAWRNLHGALSIAFILLASWHVSDLGRHLSTNMAIYIWVISGIAVLLLLKTYLVQPQSKKELSND